MSDAAHKDKIDTPAGWHGILDSGEQILWQGEPERGVRANIADFRRVLPGLAMVAFALFWTTMAMRANFFFGLFGVFFIFVGLRTALEPILWPAFVRARSFYTLTDRRAIIATTLPLQGRRLVSYPMDAQTVIEYVGTTAPSVLFGVPLNTTSKVFGWSVQGTPKRAGFEFIKDADQVIAMMRQIQRAQLPAVETAQKDHQP